MIKISVIICTYNNARCLKQALNSLVNQTLDKKLYEILVVVNNSTDESISQVKSFQLRYELPNIKLIKEKRQGLGYARNRGVAESQSVYLAFIDDDARADRDWLKNALEIMENEKLKPLASGGIILPLYEEKKPDWFKDEYEKRFWGDNEKFLEGRESLSGSNMIIRKDVIIQNGGFETKVGMKGGLLSVGEETSLFEKIRENKKENNIFYYSPKLIVNHLVANYKMTVSYQLKRSMSAGLAKFLRLSQINLIKNFAYLVFYFMVMFFFSILALLSVFRYRRYQNWLVEQFSPVFYLLGFVVGLLGFPLSIKRK